MSNSTIVANTSTTAFNTNVTTTPHSIVLPFTIFEPDSRAESIPIFPNGCCIPGGDLLWMLLVMFFFLLIMVLFCCMISVFIRWICQWRQSPSLIAAKSGVHVNRILLLQYHSNSYRSLFADIEVEPNTTHTFIYKRRMRKKSDAFRERYEEEQRFRKEIELKLMKIAMRPVKHKRGAEQRAHDLEVSRSQVLTQAERPQPVASTAPVRATPPLFNYERGSLRAPSDDYFSGLTPLHSEQDKSMIQFFSPSPREVPVVPAGDVTTTTTETTTGTTDVELEATTPPHAGSSANQPEEKFVNRNLLLQTVNRIAGNGLGKVPEKPFDGLILRDGRPKQDHLNALPETELDVSPRISKTIMSSNDSTQTNTRPIPKTTETSVSMRELKVRGERENVPKKEREKRSSHKKTTVQTGVYNTPMEVPSDSSFPYWQKNPILSTVHEESSALPVSRATSHHRPLTRRSSSIFSAFPSSPLYTRESQEAGNNLNEPFSGIRAATSGKVSSHRGRVEDTL